MQIDIDGRLVGIRYPMEVNLVGDSAETLRALNTRLEHKEDRSWREQIEESVAAWWRLLERLPRPARGGIHRHRYTLPGDTARTVAGGQVVGPDTERKAAAGQLR